MNAVRMKKWKNSFPNLLLIAKYHNLIIIGTKRKSEAEHLALFLWLLKETINKT